MGLSDLMYIGLLNQNKPIWKNFYLLCQPYLEITPQLGEQITQQVVEQIFTSF